MKSLARDVAVGILASILAALGLYGLERSVHKINAKANADIRASYAQERIAAALEHLSEARSAEDFHVDASTNRVVIGRRGVTASEMQKIESTPGCAQSAWLGGDGQVHPEYCR